MRLFTVPVNFAKMMEQKDRFASMKFKEKKESRRIEKQTVLKSVYDGKISTWQMINSDAEFTELRRKVSQEFENLFADGYKLYKSGKWSKSATVF